VRGLGWVWIACQAALAAAGCGGDAGLATSGQGITNGSLDTSAAHRAVVAVRSPQGLCSGTLITREVVLTAAHCLRSPAEDLVVIFGDSLGAGERVGVEAVVPHPDHDAALLLHDIGLLRLAAPPPEDVVPIPPLPPALGLTRDDLGLPIEFVGFGATETGAVGRKYHVVGAIGWLCEAPWCDYGDGRVGLADTLCTDQQPGGPCSGDSGGPGLVSREGRERVAGVTSYGLDEGCLDFGCSTRVDRHHDFLEAEAGGALGADCAGPGDCLSGACAGGLCCSAPCENPCRSCALPGLEGVCSALENGAPCSDGDVCNGEDDVCLRGECVPGAPLDCPADDDPCTADVCDPGLGCVHRALPEGWACGAGLRCQAGACLPEADDRGSGCRAAGPGGAGLGGVLLLLAWLARPRVRRRAAGLGLALLGLALPGLAGAAEPPAPDLARAMPILEGELDLSLLSAGQPEARWRRAQELTAGLPGLAGLDPLADSEPFLRWLGGLALTEGAVAAEVAAGRPPPPAWFAHLLGQYRVLLALEPQLRARAEALGLLGALQGEGGGALASYGAQLLGLPGHARGGLRWLAAHPPAGAPADGPGGELDLALAELARREGDYALLLTRARGLQDQPAAALLEAEALAELGRPREAEAARERARRAGASPEQLARVEARLALDRARVAAKARPSGAAEAELVARLLALGEPWRARERLDPARVHALASSALDARYLEALGAEARPLAERWAFAVAARGRPPEPGLRAARVGLGLRVLLGDLRGAGAPRVVEALRADLVAYRGVDPVLADRALLQVELVAALVGGALVAPELRARTDAHLRDHPADPAGLRAAYLLRAATGVGERPWELARRFRRALFPAPLPPEAVPLLAAAAVREVLEGGDAGALGEALEVLRPAPGAAPEPARELWLAHLHAAAGLGAGTEAEGAPHLQAAVDGYTRVLGAPGVEVPELCDAAVSLGCLLLEQGSPAGARELIGRTPACHQTPEALALLAVAELARGAELAEGAPSPAAILAEVLPGLGGRQAALQAHGWLLAAAEAAGDAPGAEAARREAAGLYREERARGRAPILAPDRRALLSPWLQVQLAAEPAPDHPFGLTLEARLAVRMVLFPPAALDEAKLGPLLQPQDPAGGG